MAFKKHFPGQMENEEIHAVIHRHWFNILTHFFTLIFLVIATILFFFLSPVLASVVDMPVNMGLISFIATTLFLFIWVYGFFVWIDYYFDVWVITDERVLNIEQRSLFTRVNSEVHLGRVQDVTTKIEGFLPTLLNYGDIFIQTAGEEKRFHFRNIANPADHQEAIVALVKKMQEQRYRNSHVSENSI